MNSINPALPSFPPRSLPEQMLPLEGIEWAQFELRAHFNVRYCSVKTTQIKRGTLVLVHGVTASPEFSFELFRYFLKQGFDIWAICLPGQSWSSRWLNNPHKVYVDDFATYVEALHRLSDIIPQDDGLPLILKGSSLGGHIVTRFAGEHPDVFDMVIAEVPMYGILTGKFPRLFVRLLATFAERFGYGEHYIFNDGDWSLNDHYQLSNSVCSSDPQRDLIEHYWRIQHPELRMGGMTYHWLHKAFESMRYIKRAKFLANIKAPFLIISAGIEDSVDSTTHPYFQRKIPNCELVYFANSKHSPSNERDEIRDQVIARIDDFIARNLG